MPARHRGFTLIELLLVIGIIAILASIVIVAINPAKQLAQARNRSRQHDVKQVISAVQQYVIDRGFLPSGIDTTLRMIGTDASGCSVSCGSELGDPTVFSVRVASATDDAEEEVATDDLVYLFSTDLELVQDYDPSRGNQIIGMRFLNVTVPQGATIASAFVRFTTSMDEGTGNEATSLTFSGQDADDAATFALDANNISTRPKTSATVAWNSVPNWTVGGQTHDSPDLSTIVQEIVDRAGWVSGNDIAIIVEGSGRRSAYSYDEEGSSALAALLSITYQTTGITAAGCLNLNVLTGSLISSLPMDPSLGTSGKTYYAAKKQANNRLKVVACAAELGETIAVEQ